LEDDLVDQDLASSEDDLVDQDLASSEDDLVALPSEDDLDLASSEDDLVDQDLASSEVEEKDACGADVQVRPTVHVEICAPAVVVARC